MGNVNSSLAAALRAPIRLEFHPLHRFYEGGGLTRKFRGLPEIADTWWSEDWVGSCTLASNPDPDGNVQGLSTVEVPGSGRVTLEEVLRAHPEELVGAEFAARWGLTIGVLVKILSPGGPVPLHAHPNRAFANRHLDSRWGKTEAWIMLDCPGDGTEPAYAGLGFKPGITKDWLFQAVGRQDPTELRDSVHRFDVSPGDVWVAHGGVPHLLGPRVLFIEVQEPSDHLVLPEHGNAEEDAATMGLGWETALDMLNLDGTDRDITLDRSRQRSWERRRTSGGREVGLIGDDIRFSFFDASRVEAEAQVPIEDGRFYIGIVTSGSGRLVGEFKPVSLEQGQSFCCAATLPHAIEGSGDEPVIVVRCMGPAMA